jgi:hypothetical protein
VTKKEFLRLQKTLERELPQFISRGDMMYLPPADSLLRGIHFDSSGFSKTAFYVSVFVMPLCVPTTCLVLSHGKRLRINGKFDGWDSNSPKLQQELLAAIQDEGLPFLETIQTLADFIEYMKVFGSDLRVLEALGYALARSERAEEALKVFDQIAQVNANYQWETDLQNQVFALASQLQQDPLAAQYFLGQNELKTRQILQLPEPLRRQTVTV